MDWKTITWSLFTLIFLLNETNSKQVRILGTDCKDKINNQYIVAVNTKKLKNDATSYQDVKESTASELKDYLLQNIPNSDSLKLKSLIFPNYVILLVSLEPEYVSSTTGASHGFRYRNKSQNQRVQHQFKCY